MLSRQRCVPTKDLERYKLTFGSACERVELWASLLSGIWFIPTPKELFLEKDFSEKCPHMKSIVSAWHSYLGRQTFLGLLLHSTHHWFCSTWTTFQCNGSWEPHEIANCPQPAFLQPWTVKVSTSFLFSHEHSRNGLLFSIYMLTIMWCDIYRAYVPFFTITPHYFLHVSRLFPNF